MHVTKKRNNAQAFVNLHIRPIILLCREDFLEEDFVRFYFLVKNTAEVSINFTVGLYWLTECQTGTFSLTGRDKAFKTGRMVCLCKRIKCNAH